MTFWDFLDRQFARIRAEHVAGAGVFILTGVVLALIALKPELAKDDLFKTLSQAVVVQGLVGLAMASWFTNRKKAGDAPRPTDEGES